MRKLHKIAIGVIVLIAFFFLLCYEHYSVPDGVKGTIFVIGQDTYAFDPSKDVKIEIPKPGRRFQPTFQCKVALDTFIISSLNPLRSPEGLSGYYKVTPFDNAMVKMDKLGDCTSSQKRLDYNEHLQLFLFYGRFNIDEIGLYLLDTALNIVKDLSFIIYSCESPTSGSRFYLLDSTTILFNKGYQELHVYSLIDSTSKIIASGMMEAISYNRKMVVLSVGLRVKQLNLLVDLNGRPNVKLPPIKSAGFGFSPDDSYIACLQQTYDLTNTVELYIYEIATDKMYKTRITGGGDLVWVEKEVEPTSQD